jgi:signal peptide peptidase SppA
MSDTPPTVPTATATDLWLIHWPRAERYFAGQVTARAPSGPEAPDDTTTAVIPILGPLAKDPWVEMYGGTSALLAQAAIRVARAAEDVDSIFLLIDSPGGEVAGIEELAGEVALAAEAKPVYAHIDDLGASAALWVASQATRVTANATAEVGSVGVVAVVPDTTEAWAKLGVKFHVVSTGDQKGALVDGVPVTEGALEELQQRVDDIHIHFRLALIEGRDLSDDALEKLSDGRIVGAEEALTLGLVDGLSTKTAAFMRLREEVAAASSRRQRQRRAQAESRQLRTGYRPA